MGATQGVRRHGSAPPKGLFGRRFTAATVLTALAIALSGIVGGAASAAKADKSYPAVDISALTVQELAAGTPQTSAVAATADAEGGGQSRALASNYSEKEFLVKGKASTYEGKLGGPVEITQTDVPYATRVLVRFPKHAKKFSGRVVVEPLNTSNGGKDADVVWSMLAPMLQARGDAWVGVTERATAGAALKTADPTRYADINVPSNDVAWDVLAQVGAAVRKGGGAQSPLPRLDPKHLYMAGYSQSGVDTAGFAIGLAKHYGTSTGKPMFDGYFPAAQAASATPLKSGTSVVPRFEYPVWPAVGVPVVNLEDQSGILGFTAEIPPEAQASLGVKEYVNVSSATTRRADSDKKGGQFRLYEIAGMPHAPGGTGGCEGPASTFPISSLARGTFALLNRWVETGQKPPSAPRVKMDKIAKNSTVSVDANGNALGGVRSPYLDDALVRYDAQAPGPVTCGLAGHEAPLDSAALAKEYPSVHAYMKHFTKGLDAMIKAGYIIPADKAQLIADQKAKATQVLG